MVRSVRHQDTCPSCLLCLLVRGLHKKRQKRLHVGLNPALGHGLYQNKGPCMPGRGERERASLILVKFMAEGFTKM